MRTTRFLSAALVIGLSVSSTASAQRASEFEDSWYWGLKSGVATFSPTLGGTESSLTYGAEWLITRSRGGLYVSFDESKVSTVSAVVDPSTSAGFRPVAIDRMHRVGFAALAFPKRFGSFRPYAGLGVSIELLGGAAPMVQTQDESVDDAVFDRIDQRKSQANVLGMGGVQFEMRRLAVFAQASFVPSSSSFLLGDSSLGFFEGGVRYNFGGAREGLK
ncbi:MAG TPA: hypothetical protein VIF83_09230 [Gemmatimonadaceae bacterium]|jgi:hypothetical protein